MDCEPISTLNCGNLCTATPATGLKGTLVRGRIAKDATSFEIENPGVLVPCAGFGLWTGCNGGKREIFFYGSATMNGSGTYTLGQVVRGLSPVGCSTTGDPLLTQEHTRNEEMLLGDTNIHYYFCKLCECLASLTQEVRAVYNDATQLPVNEDPGARAIVWNNGRPLLYVYWDVGGGNFIWRPIQIPQGAAPGGLGFISTVCPPTDPNLPAAYNRGCTVIDYYYDNTTICANGLRLEGAAFMPDLGSKIVHSLFEDNTPFVVADPNDSTSNLAYTFNQVLPSNGDLLIDVNINKSSTAQDPEVLGLSETYRLEIRQGATLIDTFVMRSGPDAIALVLGNAKYSSLTRNVSLAGLSALPYTFNIYIDVVAPSASTYHEIQIDSVSLRTVFSPSCT